MRDPVARKHRGRRRSFKFLRRFTLVLALILLTAGIALLTWAARDRNETPRRFGWAYTIVGGIALAVSAVITARAHAGRRPTPEAPGAPSRETGLALLAVLLLLALLSGIVLHTLVLTRARVRASDETRNRLVLRAAALDAAWDRFRSMAASSSASVAEQTLSASLPSGIATKVTVRPVERSALAAPLQTPGTPLFGQYFTLAIQASSDVQTSLARALACRLPSGEIRVLSWWERP